MLLTLQKSFGQCRAFHDAQKVMTADELLAGFMNMVRHSLPLLYAAATLRAQTARTETGLLLLLINQTHEI